MDFNDTFEAVSLPLANSGSTATVSLRPNLTIPESINSSSVESPTTPRNRGRSRSFTQNASPLLLTISEKSPYETTQSPLSESFTTRVKPDKARQEVRKLLAHILDQLENRPRPPQIWDTFKYKGVETTRLERIHSEGSSNGYARAFRSKEMTMRALTFTDGDSDHESTSVNSFSPDVAFDLLSQLKDLLLIARSRNWQILTDKKDDLSHQQEFAEKTASFRFRRSTFQYASRRSRSYSPNRLKKSTSDDLWRCVSILSSMVLEDCRFQISSPRLTRPPNALQAVTLDVAQILVHLYRDNPRVLYETGVVLVPAVSSFSPRMHGRLLKFFENGILRFMLEDLKAMQRNYSTGQADPLNSDDYGPSISEPIVAIQVDEVRDENLPTFYKPQGWMQWSPDGTNCEYNVLSTQAAAQSMETYYLSSLVCPLVAAILEQVDVLTEDLTLAHSIDSIFHFLAECKLDLSLDLLSVIANHSSRARYFAIGLLQTYYPKALGHLAVGKPFPLLSYKEALHPNAHRGRIGHPHSHQFIAWYFSASAASAVFEGSSLHDCQSCQKKINDFGLFCPFCCCAIHQGCYDSPDGSFLAHYQVANDSSTQRVAVHRFSHVHPRRLSFEPEVKKHQLHAFRLVNIFTLSLCNACRLPLWGQFAQGYRCGSCNRFVHSSCLHGEAVQRLPSCNAVQDTTALTIDWAALRASFLDHYHDILFTEEAITKYSHEEISIYWSSLWVQMQFFKYGVASGSIIVSQSKPTTPMAKGGGIDDFELQYIVKLYEAYLASGRLKSSSVYRSVLHKNGHAGRTQYMMFDWSTLQFIASVIRSPLIERLEPENDLLNVDVQDPDNVFDDLASQPFEVVTLAHIRDALGQSFSLSNDQAACIMISHLRHIGFFDCISLPEDFLRPCDQPYKINCSFPIPFGLDLSTSVETLIAAIESCLNDLDISVNETGFLLLTRKLWPSDMASDYALTRLAKAIIGWTLAEDDKLLIVLHEFIAKQKDVPGVPSPADSRSWPNVLPSRSLSSGSINNGNDYVTCRRILLSKYAARWLFALHCQNPDFYVSLLFDVITDLARDMDNFDDIVNEEVSTNSSMVLAEKVLRSILKISQLSLAFSTLDDLLQKWLEILPSSFSYGTNLAVLPRLFNGDSEGSMRLTTILDPSGSPEQTGIPIMDPWRVVIDVASKGLEGLKQGLRWLCLFASSGVDIPIATFLQLSAMARDFDSSFEDQTMLCEAAFMATWTKSIGRYELQRLLLDLHVRNSKYVIEQAKNGDELDHVYRFVRLSLSTVLLLHGCERNRLLSSNLLERIDVDGLPSRRKITKRASFTADQLSIDMDLIDVIARYVEEGSEILGLLAADFLVCFLTETTLMIPQEIETFILQNSHSLTRCAWKFYDMHIPQINDLRTALLLRVIVIDSQPLNDLLHESLCADTPWEVRLGFAAQLYQVVLDVTKPAFFVEGRQWRSNVVEIFVKFFSCLWTDEQEEIRSVLDAWTQTLLPAHMQSITVCFNEALSRAPVTEKRELVSFLLLLRNHFSMWKVLSWDVIIETLMDDEFTQRNDTEESPASAHLSMYGISSKLNEPISEVQDPDMAILQSSLVLLSLQMIADGINIDLFSFLKIKLHLVIALGFSGATLIPAPSGHSFYVHYGDIKKINHYALPCINGLMALLDAYRPFDLSPSAMTGVEDDSVASLPVGAAVVDVFLSLFGQVDDLADLPFIYAKAMLQTLTIVICKHDIENAPLRHLREQLRKAVRKASDLLILEIGYELRQLALSACQAYLKRWPLHAAGVLIFLLQNTIKLIINLRMAGDDILVEQAISFLEECLVSYSSSGVFYQLCKRTLETECFSVFRLIVAKDARNRSERLPLQDILLRDTLHKLESQPNDSGQKRIMENVKCYIDQVYHQGYSADLLQYVGRSITYIFRNAGELTADSFDPNPFLLCFATLIQYNKSQVRDFLAYVEIALRIALIRFDVDCQTLVRLLQVSNTLYRRTVRTSSGDQAPQQNMLLVLTTEVLSDGLRGKCRLTTSTLVGLAEAITTTIPNSTNLVYLSSDELSRLAVDALYFLQSSTTLDSDPIKDIDASIAVASLVLRAMSTDVGFLSRQLNEYAYERSSKHTLNVRSWNLLVLEALRSFSGETAARFFTHLSKLSFVYHLSLRAHLQTSGLHPEMSASDVNQAFIAIKLWLLLACKCDTYDEKVTYSPLTDHTSRDRNVSLVWNELWPSFERLVSQTEVDSESGDIPAIANLVWSSIADIFLFLRQARLPISMDSSSHIATLNRLKALGRGETFTSKFTRTVSAMSEPPVEVPLNIILTQITQELLAAEKVRALEAKRELGRTIPERSRRDIRVLN